MLAIISGEGVLPRVLYWHLVDSGQSPMVVELEGFPAKIDGVTPIRFRVEHLGSMLTDLRDRGVTELCLAGRVKRPTLDPAAVDSATEPFVPGIVAAITAGDDGALREILAIIEEFGFALRAVHEVMPELLPPKGVLTRAVPGERDRADAVRGSGIVAALGAVDVGQGCVVAAGQALAVEALGGTDWMLRSLEAERPKGPEGGILYKAPKPGQDLRADLPVIGPRTVVRAEAAGLKGIVIEAAGVMVLDVEAVIEACNEAGLFLWVRGAP